MFADLKFDDIWPLPGTCPADMCPQGPIVESLLAAGMEKDCPFDQHGGDEPYLTSEKVDDVDEPTFTAYTARINTYLQVCHTPPMLHIRIGIEITKSQTSTMQMSEFASSVHANRRFVCLGRTRNSAETARSVTDIM